MDIVSFTTQEYNIHKREFPYELIQSGEKKKKANATVLVKTENVSISNLEHIKVNKNSKNVVN